MELASNKAIVEQYIEAYNAFDLDRMVKLLHEEIVFRNYAGNELNAETIGAQAFGELAQQSAKLFASRRQTVVDYREAGDRAEAQIAYEAVLAADLPNGLKAGDKLQLNGRSVFGFRDGRIALIEDYS